MHDSTMLLLDLSHGSTEPRGIAGYGCCHMKNLWYEFDVMMMRWPQAAAQRTACGIYIGT